MTENKQEIGEDYQGVKVEVIQKIADMSFAERETFERNYWFANDFVSKFRLARDLILDGRFSNPAVLLNNFVHPRVEIPFEVQELVHPLKERLHFLLVKKGHLKPETMDSEVMQRMISDELRRKEEYRDLIASGVPEYVLGQWMTIDMFEGVSSQQKMEELRGWTTRALLREYIGVLSGKKIERKDIDVRDLITRIPDRVFSDPNGIKFHLIEHYIEERLMRSVTDKGVAEGLAALEDLILETNDPKKKQFLESVCNRFYDIATFPLTGNLKREIKVKGKERSFPSFEQRAFCYDFLTHGTRLLTAETGLGKTAASFLAMENSDASRVLVLAPAGGKETWMIEDEKVFEVPGNVRIIEGSADLDGAADFKEKYIVISQELLGYAENDPELKKKLFDLVKEGKFDGGIIDEIDNLNNPGAVSVRTAIDLFAEIRRNYQEKHDKDEVPIIGLSATPIRSRLSDLNVAMGILYPQHFAVSHQEETKNKKTFSDHHLNRPDIAYFTLVGERRMFRWEQATGVQEFNYEVESIKASPFEEYLYAYIANEVPVESLDKIRLLEDALFNPLLVKAEVRKIMGGRIPKFDLEEALDSLQIIAKGWKLKIGSVLPQNENDYLSADKLVELGFGDLVLSCYFSDLLENGIDTLVSEMTKGEAAGDLADLRRFWKYRPISSKYAVLEQMVRKSLEYREADGALGRNKVFIVSPSRKQGRTGNVVQRQAGSMPLYRQYELDAINDTKLAGILSEWIRDYSQRKLLVIDGDVKVGGTRDAIISNWVSDPESLALLVTLEATYQSRDYTLDTVLDPQGNKILAVDETFLGPPWYFQMLKQKAGRSQRQGQLVPLNLRILQVEDLIDTGKMEAVIYSHMLSRMALSGIVLTAEEQEFFDSKRIGNRIPLQSPEARFMRDVMGFIKGAGEEKVREFLTEEASFAREKTRGEVFAEKFHDHGRDRYHLTGHNAALVANLVRNNCTNGDGILSLGAGTLLLQRELRHGIDNVDLNPHMLNVGWEEASQYGGQKHVMSISRLPEEVFIPGSYSFVDCAFTLNWSSISAETGKVENCERVRILSQVNKVLKNGGVFCLTLPENSLDQEGFETWVGTLERHFGFEVDRGFSGMSYGRNKMGLFKRIGWCVVAKKVGEVDVKGITSEDVVFSNERGIWVSKKGKRKTGSGIAVPFYPKPDFAMVFDQFEIISGENKTIITQEDRPLEPEVTEDAFLDIGEVVQTDGVKEVHSMEFLKGEAGNRTAYLSYRNNLLRPVIRFMGFSMRDITKAEEVIANAFDRVQNRERIDERIRAYSLILKEVRRIMRESERKDVNGVRTTGK